MKKFLKIAFAAFAAIYISALGYVFFFQKSLMYHPEKEMKDISEYGMSGVTETYISSADGTKLQTWYAMPKPNMPMVVYFHGNSVNLSTRVSKFNDLMDLGYGFVAVTYRGFGRSEGKPEMEGIYNDARAAIAFANQLGYPTNELILVGESIGTGMATKMASENDVRGVLLITPYTSISDRGQETYWYLPVKYLVRDDFSNTKYIADVKAPILIIHGDQDDVIPHSHSETLAQLVTSPYKLIIYPNVNHSNYNSREVFEEMTKFFGVK